MKRKKIKLLIWDLDNTVWDGTLVEAGQVSLKESILEIIKALDRRGILQSVASKNDYSLAAAKLEEFGLMEFFLYPQINWNAKSESIKKIVNKFSIGFDTVAFIDDSSYELDEVSYHCPDILCLNENCIEEILDMDCFKPDFLTDDTINRRRMYQEDVLRMNEEQVFSGSNESFLHKLNMELRISVARENDLIRMQELIIRTNQLNTTGYSYSYEQLVELSTSTNYKCYVCTLADKYGSYGQIGLSVINISEEQWTIELLLMSCRTINRGIGSIFLNYLIHAANKANVRLIGKYIPNNKNRLMQLTYQFAGFKFIGTEQKIHLFEHDFRIMQEQPKYINIFIDNGGKT